VSNRPIVAAFVIVAAAIFFISGLRYTPGVENAFSASICGPLTDGNGHVTGDAGPCPSFRPHLMPRESRWAWAPFWVAPD